MKNNWLPSLKFKIGEEVCISKTSTWAGGPHWATIKEYLGDGRWRCTWYLPPLDDIPEEYGETDFDESCLLIPEKPNGLHKYSLPAGTVVKINGFPIRLKYETSVESGTPYDVIIGK